jgi:hypothetical protein
MNRELDDKLCAAYPRIFRDRRADMRTTLMCWGFEHGDGWYNILDNACYLIQNHINHSRKQRASTLRYNRALTRAIAGDTAGLRAFYTFGLDDPSWSEKRVEADLANPCYRKVPTACTQLIAVQVKEKFGTLRFYTEGGDDYTDGVGAMAEAMSATTCEVCGKLGKLNDEGWIQCRCEEHNGC